MSKVSYKIKFTDRNINFGTFNLENFKDEDGKFNFTPTWRIMISKSPGQMGERLYKTKENHCNSFYLSLKIY